MLRKLTIVFLIVIAGILTACSSSSDASFPSDNLELVVPSSPGGGNDMITRSVQNALTKEKLVDSNVIVANKTGGGGEVAWQYIKSQGNPHSIALTTNLLLTNKLRGKSDLSYKDLTPIATLTTEWLVVGVNSKSGITNLEDVLNRLREDPKSLKLAFGPSLGGDHHLLFLQMASLAGIDPSKLDIIVYGGGGEVTNALVGGHIDVVVHGIAALESHYKAGSVDLLAVSAPERIDAIPDVPTFKEQGYELVLPHWRGMVGPPDMTEEQVTYWEGKLHEMTKTDRWQTMLKNNGFQDNYLNSKETEEFLTKQNEQAEELLKKAGMTKK